MVVLDKLYIIGMKDTDSRYYYSGCQVARTNPQLFHKFSFFSSDRVAYFSLTVRNETSWNSNLTLYQLTNSVYLGIFSSFLKDLEFLFSPDLCLDPDPSYIKNNITTNIFVESYTLYMYSVYSIYMKF